MPLVSPSKDHLRCLSRNWSGQVIPRTGDPVVFAVRTILAEALLDPGQLRGAAVMRLGNPRLVAVLLRAHVEQPTGSGPTRCMGPPKFHILNVSTDPESGS